jgi:ribosomal RNA-processing protein 12
VCLSTPLSTPKPQAGIVKAACGCLGTLLAAQEPGAWPSAQPSFQLLLAHLTDSRPKVRKRAQGSVTEVLAALQHQPAVLKLASDAVAAVTRAGLAGPAAAARAAAAASNKQRAAAEVAITQAVSDALHLLAALRGMLPLMEGKGGGEEGGGGGRGG